MAMAMVTATRTDCRYREAGRDSFGVPASPLCRVGEPALSRSRGPEATYPDLDHPIVSKSGARLTPIRGKSPQADQCRRPVTGFAPWITISCRI